MPWAAMPEGLLKLLKFNSKSLWVWSHHWGGFAVYCAGTSHTSLPHIRKFGITAFVGQANYTFVSWALGLNTMVFNTTASCISTPVDILLAKIKPFLRLKMNDKIVYKFIPLLASIPPGSLILWQESLWVWTRIFSFCSKPKTKITF